MSAAFPRGMRLIARVARETHAANLRRGHLARRADVLGIRRIVVLGGVSVTRIAGGRLCSLQKSRRLSVRAHIEGRREVLVTREAFLPCCDGCQHGLLFLRRRCLLLRDREPGSRSKDCNQKESRNQERGGMRSSLEAACVAHYFTPRLDVRWTQLIGKETEGTRKTQQV